MSAESPADRVCRLRQRSLYVGKPGSRDSPAERSQGLEVAGGLGDLAGKVWRVGLMGESCTRDNVDAVLSAIDVLAASVRTGVSSDA